MQEIVFFGISGGEVFSIFFVNGLINSFLIFVWNKFQGIDDSRHVKNYRIRYIFFVVFQGLAQISLNNYRDVSLLVFFVAAFLFALLVFLLSDDFFACGFLNIISFVFNVIFAAYFDLIALLVFVFASQIIILAILKFNWIRVIQKNS